MNGSLQTIEYVALTRITVCGQTIKKNNPFPSGIEGVDYDSLLQERLIATLADYQRLGNACRTCGGN